MLLGQSGYLPHVFLIFVIIKVIHGAKKFIILFCKCILSSHILTNMVDGGAPEFQPKPDPISPPGRVRSALDSARKHLPSKQSLKLSAAATLGMLGSGSAGPTGADPILYPHIPGIEPTPIVRMIETETSDASPCYKVVDGTLVRSEDEIPRGQAKVMCFNRKDYDAEHSLYNGKFRYVLDPPDGPDVIVPEDLYVHLWEEIEPIRNLIPDKDRIRGIKMQKFKISGMHKYSDPQHPNAVTMGNGRDMENGNVFISLNDSVPISERDLKMSAFHEGMHLAQGLEFKEDYALMEMFTTMEKKSSANIQIFRSYKDELSNYTKSKYTEGNLVNDDMPSLHSLFSLVDESSYLDDALQGHPKTDSAELFASTGTTLHYFPHSFMASIEALEPEDREFMKGLARHVTLYFNRGDGKLKIDAVKSDERRLKGLGQDISLFFDSSAQKPDLDKLSTLFDRELLDWLFAPEVEPITQ